MQHLVTRRKSKSLSMPYVISLQPPIFSLALLFIFVAFHIFFQHFLCIALYSCYIFYSFYTLLFFFYCTFFSNQHHFFCIALFGSSGNLPLIIVLGKRIQWQKDSARKIEYQKKRIVPQKKRIVLAKNNRPLGVEAEVGQLKILRFTQQGQVKI